MPSRTVSSLIHAARHARSRQVTSTRPQATAQPFPCLRPQRPRLARRYAAYYSSAPSSSAVPSLPRRILSATLFLSSATLAYLYYTDARSIAHERLAMPIIRYFFDAETGHRMAVRLLSWPRWARPRDRGVDGPELEAELFGMPLVNPVGIAAGFDKNGDAIDGLFDLGFGYVEIGSVTPEPQPGNPQPRFFRLEEDQAAINRYGFNSLGHGHALASLRTRLVAFSRSHPEYFPSPLPRNPSPPTNLPRSLRPGHLLAVNLGKNKTSPADSNEDYIRGVRTLGPYADVVVINVSSPNTPGLRALQGREILERLLRQVVDEREKIKDVRGLPKIAVKVACDLTEEELVDVAYAVRQSGVDGVIMSNTTVRREGLGLQSPHQNEIGGLSGKPLFPLALNALRTLRPLLPSSIPIIGAGGIASASDSLAMARAGASIVQLYTAFGYRGVGTPSLLKAELSSTLLASEDSHSALGGGSTWAAEVGKDWNGQELGWSVGRLEQESEALRREAESLARMLRQMDEEEGQQAGLGDAEGAWGKNTPTQTGQGEARDDLLGARRPSTDVPGIDQARQEDVPAGARRQLQLPTGEEAEGVARDPETVGRRELGSMVVEVEEPEQENDPRRPPDGPRRLL